MDGVIIDSEGKYLEYIYEFAREKRRDIQIEELYGTVGATKRDCWEIVEKAVANGQSWEELRREYHERGIWKRAFEEVDYQAIFRPEVLEVMDELKAMGIRLAVASSTGLEQVKRILTMNTYGSGWKLRSAERCLSGASRIRKFICTRRRS